ncbi:hypothetical protein B0I37DRAFT_374445 [Chaetomium sp. MPI-CAGE-AT-0009]|nr:hypothetical protein B0I37DRAFT_374445 [Chaetomium sp. MPI-CAGE-AT-0009]
MSSTDNPSDAQTGNDNFALYTVGNDNIAAGPFYVLNWVFLSLCIVAFSVRAYIRFVCFGKLVVEDYLMLVALTLHSAQAVLIQLYVGYMYDVEAVEKGNLSKIGPDFLANSNKAFIAIGAGINITVISVLIVKLNFLLFFKRLGAHIRKFNIAWWIVTAFTVGGAIVLIGFQEFRCFFGGIEHIFSNHCVAEPVLRRIFIKCIFSAVVDAVSDMLILCFPIWILWGSGISMRKKLALTFVFSLVWFTIAITIVRGSVFHEQYSMAGVQSQSATFTWFWFHVELSVAFLVACIVSFRSLFVRRAKESALRQEQQERREDAYHSAIRHGRGWRAKWQQMHESVLDKCKTLEGWSDSDARTRRGLPTVPSGLMTGGGGTVEMTAVTTIREDTEYYQHPQYRQYHQSPAPTGSMHSEETLLQNPEAAYVRKNGRVVGIAL